MQSWVSLKRYADSLTEELKQSVLSVEGIEDTFNANELERQNKFETAEQSRQSTFEASESERDETFSTNETTRQAQELEREKAESQRQSVFDDNEASRDGIFNANEVLRQENETSRQQAETQRATAESSRVSAEEQRKIDHENRSAELDAKANKKQEDWITPTLLNGWEQQSAYAEVGYYKDDFGVVHLRGTVRRGEARANVFILPPGYRPIKFVFYSVPVTPGGTTIGSIYVDSNGAAYSYHTGEGLSLNHISFRAER